jgi:UDP-N-acetylmuramoyl-L-alanyl-D-glutamate--2,6-diaminopimelate ligase
LALSRLSALEAGDPSKKMQLVGITGTNGKTTTHWLIYHAYQTLAAPALRIGTLGAWADGCVNGPESLTTPDASLVQTYLAQALAAGVRFCVMEASSHALCQARVDHVYFDVGAFTNLTRDHLDYHGDMERYFEAKARLFDLIAAGPKSVRAAAVNLDDPYGLRLQEKIAALKLNDFSYGRDLRAAIKILSFAQTNLGSTLLLGYNNKRYELKSHFIGDHNASNLAAAFAGLLALGFNPGEIVAALAKAPPVPGRLEPVGNAKVGVYVDYAHTPDALEKALITLRPIVKRKLWVLFGCGGDRDRGKRPQMGSIAARLADGVVVTSDNPRTEDPQKIIDDILSSGIKPAVVEADRRIAIAKCIGLAQDGDVVLLAGKGHENYQIIGSAKLPFSDGVEAKRVLAGC